MNFTVAGPSTALPPRPRPAQDLAPLKPSARRWLRETADGLWRFEHLEDEGSTWVVQHVATKTVVAEYLPSLKRCRIYVGSGEAQAELDRILSRKPGYRCCAHCEHFEDDYDPKTWRHDDPCPHGCDDEGTAP